MKAASSGPMAEPALPPTWNTDCAKPWRPPEARRATREASGWKMAEPSPIRQAPSTRIGKLCAWASVSSPAAVESIATGEENGIGQRSVTVPTTGCRNEAVTWKAKVSSPIWAKSSA